jgi:hypothetical protein
MIVQPAALEGEPKTKDEFVGKVDTFIKDGGVLERFFKDKIDFVQTIAKKTVDLSNDTSTSLGEPEVLPKTVKVNLHQQVIYCGMLSHFPFILVESYVLTPT